jgi:hypothetical protein
MAPASIATPPAGGNCDQRWAFLKVYQEQIEHYLSTIAVPDDAVTQVI